MADISALAALHRLYNEGDWTLLIERLRDPTIALSTEERELIAGRLEGTFKFSRGARKKNFYSDPKRAQMVFAYGWLTRCKDWQSEAAQERVAESAKVTARTVRTAVADFKKNECGASHISTYEYQIDNFLRVYGYDESYPPPPLEKDSDY